MSDGFDYTKLPKPTYDDYDIPESRGGWHFRSLGGIAVGSWIIAVLLSVVLMGTTMTSPIGNWHDDLAVGISFVPFLAGIISLFKKVGRWWGLLTLLATISFIGTPFILAIIFIQFANIIAF